MCAPIADDTTHLIKLPNSAANLNQPCARLLDAGPCSKAVVRLCRRPAALQLQVSTVVCSAAPVCCGLTGSAGIMDKKGRWPSADSWWPFSLRPDQTNRHMSARRPRRSVGRQIERLGKLRGAKNRPLLAGTGALGLGCPNATGLCFCCVGRPTAVKKAIEPDYNWTLDRPPKLEIVTGILSGPAQHNRR